MCIITLKTRYRNESENKAAGNFKLDHQDYIYLPALFCLSYPLFCRILPCTDINTGTSLNFLWSGFALL